MAPSVSANAFALPAPDFTGCGRWYANPVRPRIMDCMAALNDLPLGNDPVAWYTHDVPEGIHDAYTLPMDLTKGTCQIRIQASGKYIEDHSNENIRLTATPTSIWNAALATINECVGIEHKGGYSTVQFSNLLDWITAPNTVFPGNLAIPEATTFITAMVWNYEPGSYDLEPGSYDEWTASHLRENLEKAADKAAEGSALRRDLQERAEYVHGSQIAIINHDGEESGFAWWHGFEPGFLKASNQTSSVACDVRSRLRLPFIDCDRMGSREAKRV